MTDNAQGDREDVPRISVDSLADWERIKASYAEAAMNELEESYVHSVPTALRVHFVFIAFILVKNEEREEERGEQGNHAWASPEGMFYPLVPPIPLCSPLLLIFHIHHSI